MELPDIDAFFSRRDHKSLMLQGLLIATAALFSIFAAIAATMGHYDIVAVKLGLAVLLILFYLGYRRSGKTQLYAFLFLMVVESESISAMFGGHFYDFVTIFPFFAIFGFFYFFSLRMAFLLTFVHYLFWTVWAYVVYSENADNPVFHHVPLLNMLSTTAVVIVIAVIYHLSTEVTYQRLERADRQKTLLLREIHHRIKNNLNRIASLFGLQIVMLQKGDERESAVEMLEKNKLRIEAMAMVHDALYRADDLEKIAVGKYIANLKVLVCTAFAKDFPVDIRTDGSVLPLEKVMRIGIILNEWCANTVKHLPSSIQEDVRITIGFACESGQCTLSYTQSGVTADIDENTLLSSKGIGMTLVRLSAEELDGTFDVTVDGARLHFTVTFPFQDSAAG